MGYSSIAEGEGGGPAPVDPLITVYANYIALVANLDSHEEGDVLVVTVERETFIVVESGANKGVVPADFYALLSSIDDVSPQLTGTELPATEGWYDSGTASCTTDGTHVVCSSPTAADTASVRYRFADGGSSPICTVFLLGSWVSAGGANAVSSHMSLLCGTGTDRIYISNRNGRLQAMGSAGATGAVADAFEDSSITTSTEKLVVMWADPTTDRLMVRINGEIAVAAKQSLSVDSSADFRHAILAQDGSSTGTMTAKVRKAFATIGVV